MAVAALSWAGAFAPTTSSGAATVSGLKSKAAALAARVDAMNAKLGILAEEYDQAHLRAGLLAAKIRADRSQIHLLEGKVTRTKHQIAVQAIDSYVHSGTTVNISPGATPNETPARQTYLEVVAGNLDASIAVMRNDQRRLSLKEETLSTEQAAATQATDTIASSQTQANGLEQQLRSALANVNAQMSSMLAAEEAAQLRAAAQQQAVTAEAAAAQIASPPPPSAGPQSAPVTTTSSGAAAAAVAAARSQLGVPYAWGGATPGAGFDCSGLAMWAWGQAGVDLPHSAQAQYDSIPHVSLSDLQPGDLVFYASGGYIYHVIMYIGGGEAIQATTFGQPVQITPVWPGAIGAGRP